MIFSIKNLCAIYLSFFLFSTVVSAQNIYTDSSSTIRITSELTREQSFIQLADIFKDNIPDSYHYIQLNFKGISEGSELESALKILVYTDIIQNATTHIYQGKPMNAYVFYRIAEKISGSPLLSPTELLKTKTRNATMVDHDTLKSFIA